MDPKNKQIHDARDMAKKHTAEVADPKCAAQHETSADMLDGLEKAWQ